MPDRGGRGGEGASEVLFEFTQVGQQMRVAAIDVATTIEVVAIAPLSATQNQMKALALAKLERRLAEQPKAKTRRLF